MKDKTGRLDIWAETSDREQINVEIQVAPQKHMERRSLFYWSKLYADSIKAGGKYGDLKRTIAINLLDYRFLSNGRFHNRFRLYDDVERTLLLTDAMELHFVEYPKFRQAQKDMQDPLHRWLLFLEENIPNLLLEELTAMDPIIRKAEERLEWLSSDEETIRLYEAREHSLYERNSLIAEAKEEGETIGRAKGESEKSKEIARNLLSMGLDLDKIQAATGLSKEVLRRLKLGDKK